MKQPFCTPAQALRRVLDAEGIPVLEAVALDEV